MYVRIMIGCIMIICIMIQCIMIEWRHCRVLMMETVFRL